VKMRIFTKILGSSILIITGLLMFMALFAIKVVRNDLIDTYTSHLQRLASVLNHEISPFINRGKYRDLDLFLKSLSNQIGFRVTVIKSDGTIIADSERDLKMMKNNKDRYKAIDALFSSMDESKRFVSTVEHDMLYVALPIENDDGVFGVIRIGVSMKEINRILFKTKTALLWAGLIAIFFSFIFSLIISKGISTPLKRLGQALKTISQDDFKTGVFFREDHELKDLTDSLNEMALKAFKLVDTLSKSNEALKTIISSIQEPLCVLEHQGKIKLSNESFKNLLNNHDVEGKFYWEVIRSPALEQLIKKAFLEKRPIKNEVKLNSRIFLCNTTFLDAENGLIALFHEITEFKRLEQIKKDFVSNISHELRTPLTAMKGFLETFEEEEEIKNVHYLDVVKRHMDRMMHIVNDLLVLSELEDNKFEIVFEDISLNELTENILKIFDVRIKEKALTLQFNVKGVIPYIKGDPFKLEQMIINLLDNAIKYTEKGGITISIEFQAPNVVMSIEDTGIGIPAEHLSRIFERFYVVDKSRSKRLGGTGLGLSIVKHIVLLHNGYIEAKSIQGKGTTFIIFLPLNS